MNFMYLLSSRLLSSNDGIIHAFTTRHCGQSSVPYSGNNLAFHVGDVEKDVLANHAALADRLGYKLDALVHMRQIHSGDVAIADEHSFTSPPECDAVVTDTPGKPLMVMTADCTPVLLYDDRKGVIAAIHAGRAGAFKNIVANTVGCMQSSFGCETKEIIAVLGPSIGECCYEVGEAINEEAESLGLGYAMRERNGRFFLDVNAILKKQLHEIGIVPEHIEEIKRCTACEHDTFFSYRADNRQTGRMAAVIMLR